MPEPSDFPTIVLAIDGLRASAWGAYGQTAYETPALDALAVESITHDWCYAPTPEPRDLYARVAAILGPDAVVLTDDPDATRPLAEAGARVVELPAPEAGELAESIDATTTAAAWAAFAERLVELAEGDDFPSLLWVHARGLYGPWDAPAELFAPLVDEEDPEFAADTAPPDAHLDDVAELCEARFAASCRYAAQAMTLDACLGGWLDLLDGLFEGVEMRLVVAGLRGFPLGEHGRIGGVDHRLYSEQQHVPLWVRDSDPSNRFSRVSEPTTLDAAIAAVLAGGAEPASEARLRSDSADALVADGWMLRLPHDGEAELYVKPDDRWDQNDVASLEMQATEELVARIKADSKAGD